MRGLIKRLKKNLISGIIFLLPLLISFLFIRFLYFKLNNLILEPGVKLLIRFLPYSILIPVFKLFVLSFVILVVALMGSIVQNLFARKIIALLENLILRLPLVGKVYKGTKEISDAILLDKKGAFRKVVLVEYPKEGSYAIGFITHEDNKEIDEFLREKVVCVFVPTTPNPTSGFILYIPKSKTIPLDISVEEGIKLVISFGMTSR